MNAIAITFVLALLASGCGSGADEISIECNAAGSEIRLVCAATGGANIDAPAPEPTPR